MIHFIKSHILVAGAISILSCAAFTSCDLDLKPEDYYGSGNFWTSEAQVDGFVKGLHADLRSRAFEHTITFGELRGGAYKLGLSADGSTLNSDQFSSQNFDVDHTGVTNWGDLYGALANINLFIKNVTDANYISDSNKKKYYLGIAYGLRAFYYFDLYRIYGGVPLRLDNKVVEGVLDPNELYLARSSAKETMAQIKSDIQKSLENFGDDQTFDEYATNGQKGYWSKAATECLAGEVYLWNAKVTEGDNPADINDLKTAKMHLENVMNNYNLKMLDNFSDVFEAKTHKGNDEVIFAVRFVEGEAENNNSTYTYSLGTGLVKSFYKEDGSLWGDPMDLKNSGTQRYEYNPLLFESFDKNDTRRNATFIASYSKDANGSLELYGTHVCKNIGYVNSEGNRVFCGDYIIYRLPWVYLSLAEIANMEGDNASVAKYINLVRKRAYASNWDEAKYGYKAGDFTQNELAILHEKDKEFIQEGQRWFDLCRMTLTKGGKHLVFCKEGSLDGKAPLLDETTEAYKVLWPVDKETLNEDPKLVQTPGYTK